MSAYLDSAQSAAYVEKLNAHHAAYCMLTTLSGLKASAERRTSPTGPRFSAIAIPAIKSSLARASLPMQILLMLSIISEATCRAPALPSWALI